MSLAVSACGFSALWLLHGCYSSWMGPRFLQTSWAHTLGKHEAGREEAQLVRAGISLHCPGELGRAPLLVRGTAMWKGVLGAALELGPGCGLHAMRWGWPRLFPGRPATGFAPHSQPRDLLVAGWFGEHWVSQAGRSLWALVGAGELSARGLVLEVQSRARPLLSLAGLWPSAVF